MNTNKYWDDKYGDVGHYSFIMCGKEIGVLKDVQRAYKDSTDYVKRKYENGRYLLHVCIGGDSYKESLKAKTLEEAKAEFERWLADYYNGRIVNCKMAIKHYEEQLEYLK